MNVGMARIFVLAIIVGLAACGNEKQESAISDVVDAPAESAGAPLPRSAPPPHAAPSPPPPESAPAPVTVEESAVVEWLEEDVFLAESRDFEIEPAAGGLTESSSVVDVYFATDRRSHDSADIKSRFGAERGDLKYGITQISIPHDHETGQLEAPSIWKLEFRENPEKHVMMLDIKVYEKEDYFNEIAKSLSNSDKKRAFIFVHGYNVTFEDAARRTGQIAYDLDFDGAPVFYSWPSHGSTAKYTFDEDNIKWSQTNIERFLKDFAEKSDAENIYLIAHSMGNRAVTRAYIAMVQKNPQLKSRFTEIILAAPDIDADVFKREIAPEIVKSGNPITLYASSEDIPLKASKAVHGGHPRAGDSGDDIVVVNGIETIDSTNVRTDLLGHSTATNSRSIISDMYYIFGQNIRANDRAGLVQVQHRDGTYWKFKK